MNTPKSLLRAASENLAISTAGELLVKLFGIIGLFVLLSLLAPYEFGVWRLLQSVLTGMSLFTLTGITGLLVADIAREMGERREDRARTIIRRSFTIFFVGGVSAAAILGFAAPVISSVSGINLTVYLWILAAGLVFSGLLQTYQLVFQARLASVQALALKLSGSLLYLGAITVLLSVFKLGVMGVVAGYVLSLAIPALAYTPRFLRSYRRRRDEKETGYSLREAMWSRGRWALGEDYASLAVNALWPWVVGYFLGIEEIGYIGLALLFLSQVFSFVPLSYILRTALPRLAHDEKRVLYWMHRGVRYAVWIYTITAIGAGAFLSIVLPVFFPAYASALPVFFLLLLSVPFSALNVVLAEWFYAHKQQRAFFFTTAVPKICALALLPVLLFIAGMSGFALWYVISGAVVALVRLAYLRKAASFHLHPNALIILDKEDISLLGRALRRLRQLVGRPQETL